MRWSVRKGIVPLGVCVEVVAAAASSSLEKFKGYGELSLSYISGSHSGAIMKVNLASC